jgi:hypothetical protein
MKQAQYRIQMPHSFFFQDNRGPRLRLTARQGVNARFAARLHGTALRAEYAFKQASRADSSSGAPLGWKDS